VRQYQDVALDAARSAGLPIIEDAERSVQALAALLSRPRQLAPRLESPTQTPGVSLLAGNGPLSGHASLELIARAGLPTARWGLATSEEEAAGLTEHIGPPVAMKNLVSRHSAQDRAERRGAGRTGRWYSPNDVSPSRGRCR